MDVIPDVLEKYLGVAVAYDEHKLATYNTAYFNATAVLYVPDNVEIDQPVEALSTKTAPVQLPLTNVFSSSLEKCQA